jgi:hypothetical protein
MQRSILIVVFLAFGVQGAFVLGQIGYWRIWTDNLSHVAGQQVFADLVISLCLVMSWMRQDAKANGRRFWPWLVATLLVGSFSPLLYLIVAKPARETASKL